MLMESRREEEEREVMERRWEEEGMLMESRREEEEREARGQPDFVKYQKLGYACHVFSS